MGPKTNSDKLRIKTRKYQYHDRGYCKHGETCNNKHPEESCNDETCSEKNCDKRHPNPCKFGYRCKYKKKNVCSYSHITLVSDDKNDDLEKKLKVLSDQMRDRQRQIDQNESENSDKINELLKKIEIMEKKIQKKDADHGIDKEIKQLENIIDSMKKSVDEKESKISNLEKKIEEMENKITGIKIDPLKRKVKDMESHMQKHQTICDSVSEKLKKTKRNVKKEAKTFTCDHFDYTTDSSRGLKTHAKRKHTQTELEKFPQQCDLCDCEIENIKDMKTHMKSHSYKQITYQCEECDYCGKNKMTIEVHLEKNHNEKFECGLCEYVANDLENLDTHLFTCEIYE